MPIADCRFTSSLHDGGYGDNDEKFGVGGDDDDDDDDHDDDHHRNHRHHHQHHNSSNTASRTYAEPRNNTIPKATITNCYYTAFGCINHKSAMSGMSPL